MNPRRPGIWWVTVVTVTEHDAEGVALEEQIQCVQREIAMRRRTYPRWIAAGKLAEANADLEERRMRAVLRTLLQVRGENT